MSVDLEVVSKSYVDEARKTMNPDADHIEHCIDGLCTEAGELLNCFKKKFHGKGVDRVSVLEECGDICWYAGNFFELLHCPLPLPTDVHYDMDPHEVARDIFRVAGLALEETILSETDESHVENVVSYVEEIMEMLCFLIDHFESSWSQVLDTNIHKLQKVRYKDGFSRDATEARDLEAERAGLEERTQ